MDEFGEERVRDTPISEAVIAGAAAGSAVTGMRPIAELMFMDFSTIAMDAIVNQAAKMRYMFGGKAQVPFVLRCPAGSGTGAAAQHSQSLEAWFCHIPGLKVVAASTPYDVKGLPKSSIRDNNPVIFVEQKLLYRVKGEVPEEEYTIPLGKADIKREGKDVTVVTYGRMLQRVLEAAEEAEKDGISVEVVDPRTLVPLDTETIIKSVMKTGRLIVLNEAVKTGSFAGEIVSRVVESEAFDYLDSEVIRLSGKDTPIPYNPKLEASVVPNKDDIKEAIYKAMGKEL